MKRFLQILVTRELVGDAVVDHLCRLFPAGNQRTSFDARLRDDSPVCAEVLRTLAEAGCRPRVRGEPYGPGMFSMWPNYEYEQADLEQADYFEMLPHQDVKTHYGRSPEGTLNLKQPGLARKGPLLIAIPWVLLVSSPLRGELEGAGFVGLAFRQTQVVKGKSYQTLEEVPWSKVGCEPYWELTASVDLPPLSPRCLLMNEKGERIRDDDWSNGVFLMEDQFPAGELHYRRSDLRDIPCFDLALTHEPFGNRPSEYNKHLVMSRRVYDFINARRLKVMWLPVYVDDE